MSFSFGQNSEMRVIDDNAGARYFDYSKLKGVIVDSATLKPIPGALVTILAKEMR